jgi:hypothetical protein
MTLDLETKCRVMLEPLMRRRPPNVPAGKRHVLQRLADGKYLEVCGWSVEWGDEISALCPVFTKENTGPNRADDFHRRLLIKHLSLPKLKYLECADQLCKLVEVP